MNLISTAEVVSSIDGVLNCAHRKCRNDEEILLNFGGLPKHLYEVVVGRLQGRTLREIGLCATRVDGSLGGVTQEVARQREAKAFRKLRHPSRAQMLCGLSAEAKKIIGIE